MTRLKPIISRLRAKVAEAEANLGAARRQIDVLETQRPQFRADIDAAVAALTLAEIELTNTVVRAPSDGRVGERQARVGQHVRPGTLLVAIVPQDFWVVANFKETQIPAMRIGDGITISNRWHPGKGDGHHRRAQDCERGTDLGSRLCDPGAGPDDGRAARSGVCGGASICASPEGSAAAFAVAEAPFEADACLETAVDLWHAKHSPKAT